jgi:hypothetical protein
MHPAHRAAVEVIATAQCGPALAHSWGAC